jgi:hypothetical protein
MFSTTNLLTILLAIPAVLAAPATEAKAAAKQVKACACVNAAGQTGAVDGYCQYIAGGIVNLDGQKYVNITFSNPLPRSIANDIICSVSLGPFGQSTWIPPIQMTFVLPTTVPSPRVIARLPLFALRLETTSIFAKLDD